jgi:hypothetical protein
MLYPMTGIIVVAMFVAVGLWAVTSLSRTAERVRGHAICTFCGKRLKKVGGKYAGTCKACGKDQPWALRRRAG